MSEALQGWADGALAVGGGAWARADAPLPTFVRHNLAPEENIKISIQIFAQTR